MIKYISIEKDCSIPRILELLAQHNVDPKDASIDVETSEDQDSLGNTWPVCDVYLTWLTTSTKKDIDP